jgi:hypothetical protein
LVIRRLILCGPYTPEEARAATAMAGKMVGGSGEEIVYRAAPTERRIVMFQADGISFSSSGIRRQHSRLLDDPAAQALAVVNAAVIRGEPVINVYTGLERDGEIYAYSGTDAVLTFGFPDGAGVAYFHRVAGGVAPGVAAQCLWFAHGARSSPVFMPQMRELLALRDGVRFSFVKRKPFGWQAGRQLAIEHARSVLAASLERFGLT